MRIMIVTDSLGGPRKDKIETIKYEDTWCYIIKKYIEDLDKKKEVIIFNHYGYTVGEIFEFIDYYLLLYSPKIIIFQFGIVDCVYRALRKKEILIINLLKLEKFIRPIISKYHYFLTKIRKIRYTSPKNFKKYLKMIMENLIQNNVMGIFLAIAPACQKFKEKSFFVEENIKIYNSILEEEVKNNNMIFIKNLFPNNSNIDDLFLDDGHHLNKKGHLILSQTILEHIRNLILSANQKN